MPTSLHNQIFKPTMRDALGIPQPSIWQQALEVDLGRNANNADTDQEDITTQAMISKEADITMQGTLLVENTTEITVNTASQTVETEAQAYQDGLAHFFDTEDAGTLSESLSQDISDVEYSKPGEDGFVILDLEPTIFEPEPLETFEEAEEEENNKDAWHQLYWTKREHAKKKAAQCHFEQRKCKEEERMEKEKLWAIQTELERKHAASREDIKIMNEKRMKVLERDTLRKTFGVDWVGVYITKQEKKLAEILRLGVFRCLEPSPLRECMSYL